MFKFLVIIAEFVFILFTGCTGLRIFTSSTYSYKSLHDRGLNSKATSVTFQVVACSDVHVGFFDYTSTNVKYEFVIGGWSNQKSVMRTGDTILRSVDNTPLTCCRFNPFWISWQDSVLCVGYGEEVGVDAFIEYPANIENVKKVAVSTGYGHRGVWVMKFDNIPLTDEDFDVDGYLDCSEDEVTYYLQKSTYFMPVMTSAICSVYTACNVHVAETSSEMIFQITSSNDLMTSSKDALMTSSEDAFMTSSEDALMTSSEMSMMSSEESFMLSTELYLTSTLFDEILMSSYISSPRIVEELCPTATVFILSTMTSCSHPETSSVIPDAYPMSTADTLTDTCDGCPCPWPFTDTSDLHVTEKVNRIRASLTLEKGNLSAVRRRLTSAYDVRPSSRYMGASGATIIVLVFGLIVLADVQRILMFFMDRKKGNKPLLITPFRDGDTSSC